MLKRTVAAGVGCGGSPRTRSSPQNPGLRDYLGNATIAYVMAIPKSQIEDNTAIVRHTAAIRQNPVSTECR